MSTPTTRPPAAAEQLARMIGAMEAVHAGLCDHDPLAHSAFTCRVTPTIFAIADAIDQLDADASGPAVALALHNRLCRDQSCGPAEAQAHSQAGEFFDAVQFLTLWNDHDDPAGQPWLTYFCSNDNHGMCALLTCECPCHRATAEHHALAAGRCVCGEAWPHD